MQETTLRPCPFCGCSVHIEEWREVDLSRYYEITGDHDETCFFTINDNPQYLTSKPEAIMAWNRRTTYLIEKLREVINENS